MGEPDRREKVLYLYGVVPIGQSVPSTADISLENVSHATLTAIVEPVLAADFSGEALENHLKSIEWVAGLARKHEAVLDQAMRGGSVIPARLCTLFSDGAALRRSLTKNEDWFVATLKRLGGREEWGLKAYCDDHALRRAVAADNPEMRDDDAATLARNPGRAFILRKRREAQLAEAVTARLDALVDETIDALEEVTDEVRLRPLLQAETTGRNEPMVLNAAALVSTAARAAFHEAVAEMRRGHEGHGLMLELSGPWPAYSFCEANGGRHGE